MPPHNRSRISWCVSKGAAWDTLSRGNDVTPQSQWQGKRAPRVTRAAQSVTPRVFCSNEKYSPSQEHERHINLVAVVGNWRQEGDSPGTLKGSEVQLSLLSQDYTVCPQLPESRRHSGQGGDSALPYLMTQNLVPNFLRTIRIGAGHA